MNLLVKLVDDYLAKVNSYARVNYDVAMFRGLTEEQTLDAIDILMEKDKRFDALELCIYALTGEFTSGSSPYDFDITACDKSNGKVKLKERLADLYCDCVSSHAEYVYRFKAFYLGRLDALAPILSGKIPIYYEGKTELLNNLQRASCLLTNKVDAAKAMVEIANFFAFNAEIRKLWLFLARKNGEIEALYLIAKTHEHISKDESRSTYTDNYASEREYKVALEYYKNVVEKDGKTLNQMEDHFNNDLEFYRFLEYLDTDKVPGVETCKERLRKNQMVALYASKKDVDIDEKQDLCERCEIEVEMEPESDQESELLQSTETEKQYCRDCYCRTIGFMRKTKRKCCDECEDEMGSIFSVETDKCYCDGCFEEIFS